MKKLFFVLAIILIGTVVFGQTLINKKNFGGISDEWFTSVTYDSNDKAYIAVGYSFWDSFGTGDWDGIVNKGELDAIIVKYDTDFNIIWKKHFGGTYSTVFNSVTYDSSANNYVVVGHVSENSFGTGDWTGITGNGDFDAIIIKYDADGNVLSKKNFGGIAEDIFGNITYDSSDNTYVVAGYSYEASFGTGDWVGATSKGEYGDCDATIVKFDANLNVLWKNNFGGNSQDYFNSVTCDSSDHSYVVVGYGYIDSGDWTGITSQGYFDAVMVKYDTDGNMLWKKHFGGIELDVFSSVTYDPNENAYVTVGYSDPSSFETGDLADVVGKGDFDATIVKFDTNGNVLDKNNFGGGNEDYFNSVAYDSSANNYVATGYSYMDSFGTGDWINTAVKGPYSMSIVKFNDSCNLLFENNFGGGGSEYPTSLTYDNIDNSFVTVGNSTADTFGTIDWTGVVGKGGLDSIIVKFQYPVAVTGVSVTPKTSTMYVGDTLKLTATVAPANATNKKVVWSVKDTLDNKRIFFRSKTALDSAISISQDGTVNALKVGTAYAYVASEDGGFKDYCYITVKAPINVTSVQMLPTSIYVKKNNTVKVIAKILPINATNKKVSWKSSNTGVATVSETGDISGVRAGVTFVTVTTLNGNKKATCKVTVRN